MLLIIPHRHLLARIRIAILAKVRAGVVFADVFAQDAAAELPLAFVAVVPLLEGVLRFAQPDGAGGDRLRAKQGVFHRLFSPNPLSRNRSACIGYNSRYSCLSARRGARAAASRSSTKTR